MNIKLVKLKNGEDFIADILENDLFITVYNPIRLVPMGQQLGFMHWIPISANTTYDINYQDILLTCDIVDDVKNAYSSQFGGIVLPNTKLQL